MKAPALKQQRRLVELHTTTHHRWTRKRHQPMPAVILAKMPARTAPEIVPILGPVASLPPSAIPVESDRILLLIEEPAVCNEVYQAMETVGHAGTPECPVIYARSPGG